MSVMTAKMHMTDDEIRKTWENRATSKRKQLAVMAELNACTKQDMREKLLELGYENIPDVPKPAKRGKPPVKEEGVQAYPLPTELGMDEEEESEDAEAPEASEEILKGYRPVQAVIDECEEDSPEDSNEANEDSNEDSNEANEDSNEIPEELGECGCMMPLTEEEKPKTMPTETLVKLLSMAVKLDPNIKVETRVLGPVRLLSIHVTYNTAGDQVASFVTLE